MCLLCCIVLFTVLALTLSDQAVSCHSLVARWQCSTDENKRFSSQSGLQRGVFLRSDKGGEQKYYNDASTVSDVSQSKVSVWAAGANDSRRACVHVGMQEGV